MSASDPWIKFSPSETFDPTALAEMNRRSHTFSKSPVIHTASPCQCCQSS